MSYVMEWYQNGIITQEETGGLAFDWGNYRSMIAMIPQIAARQGFGAVLADGAVTAAQRIGRGADKYLNSCKGMVIGGQDFRGMKGTSLGFATATRGCDHLRGGNVFEVPMGGKPLISPEEAVERFGSEHILDHDSYEKARPVVFFQNINTLADSLQICKFNTSHNGHGINVQDMADIFTAVTGVEADESGLFAAANRIYTVERCFSVREGITKKDDFFQGKWAREATSGGRFDGCRFDRKKFDRMLEDYYGERGWDTATGIPTKETLNKLGLDKVSRELKRLGIID
jgi:aldehyde:ferredoxin oxidoreductase